MFCQKCGTENPDNGKFCRNCGTNLKAMSETQAVETRPSDYYVNRKGRIRSNNPDDLWSSGIKNTVSGVGFLVVAMVLFLTNVAGGHAWWWAMLFPAFSMLSSGIGSIAKSKRLEKRQLSGVEQQQQQTLFAQTPANAGLPPLQTDYPKPQNSIYDTGDLVAPPSVAEGTTRHLKMNSEFQSVTSPENEANDEWKNGKFGR